MAEIKLSIIFTCQIIINNLKFKVMEILAKLDKNNLKNCIIDKITLFDKVPSIEEIEIAIRKNGKGVYLIVSKGNRQYWFWLGETFVYFDSKRKLSIKELNIWIKWVKENF